MDDIKYSYAINQNGDFVDIYDANREDSYHILFAGRKIEMIPVMGEVYQWHFRCKEYIGMTPEHFNLQVELCEKKRFYCKSLDIQVNASFATIEYKLPFGRIIDVAYFDSDNNFLCGIEVVNTNDVDREKFKELYQSDYLIFKVYTNDPEKFIFIGNSEIERIASDQAEAELREYNKKYENQFNEYKQKIGEEEDRVNEQIRIIETRFKSAENSIREQINPLIDRVARLEEDRHEFNHRSYAHRRKIETIRLRTVRGGYFERLQAVRDRLMEAKGEEGQLIKDIREITEQINNLILFC